MHNKPKFPSLSVISARALSLLDDTAVARIANDKATIFVTIPRTALIAGSHDIGVGQADEVTLWAAFDGLPLTAKFGELRITTSESSSGGIFEATITGVSDSIEEPTLSVSGNLKGTWQ